MPSIGFKEYEYGHPLNEDYAYDKRRQDKLEEEMANDHVSEPFRNTLDTTGGGNLFELQARSERLTIDVARKQMCNDVLRAMLSAKAGGAQAQAQVDAVVALCDAEARK